MVPSASACRSASEGGGVRNDCRTHPVTIIQGGAGEQLRTLVLSIHGDNGIDTYDTDARYLQAAPC